MQWILNMKKLEAIIPEDKLDAVFNSLTQLDIDGRRPAPRAAGAQPRRAAPAPAVRRPRARSRRG